MFKRLVLPNGVRLILVPEAGAVTATVFVMVEAGSEYENKENNGISHFLEHLVFKGTTTRPEPGRIIRELDGLGAHYNAFTSQEHTAYYAKVQSDKVETALELISDMHLNPIFDEREIEKERGAVIEEINMYEDLPMRRVHEILMRLMYGDQPAGWDIAGPKENIRRLSRGDFVTYRNKHYIAPATAIVVAGKFDEKKIVNIVRTNFGNLPKATKVKKSKTKEGQLRPQVVVKQKKSDQSHLALATRVFSAFDPRRFALHLLAAYLGGGMSSRLFVRVREELGAAYYVRAAADLYIDHGLLVVSAGVDHTKIKTVINAILEEMKLTTQRPIDKADLKRTRDHLIGNMIVGLDTSEDMAAYYGSQEIMNQKIATPEELIKKYQAVTASQIQVVAKEVFRNKNLNLAVIGPYKDPSGLKKILHF